MLPITNRRAAERGLRLADTLAPDASLPTLSRRTDYRTACRPDDSHQKIHGLRRGVYFAGERRALFPLLLVPACSLSTFSSLAFRNSSLRGPFGDAISEMDAAVGQLVDVLRDIGLLDNTLIFLTSDNGARSLPQGKGQGGSSGLFKCGKGTTYEGGHRVPALLHWPAKISPRRESSIVSMTSRQPWRSWRVDLLSNSLTALT